MTRLAQLLSIRQGEGNTASLVIGIMLLTAMGASLGGTGIDALFFARFGVEYLPYMYMGLGLTSMTMSFGVTALLSRLPRQFLYLAIPVLLAILLVAARFALLSGASWLYPALWLGKEVLNIFITLVIWGMAGVVFNTRQAKRLFPLFNASRILGYVVGGFITGLLVSLIGTENLLLAWAGALLVVFILGRTLLAGGQAQAVPEGRKSRRRQTRLIQEMQLGYQYVRNSPLMKWIAISTVFFSILFFSLALPFSRAATDQYVNEDSLAAFLGLFNGLSTGAAFLSSLLLANRLMGRFGIMVCILTVPIVYLIGFATLWVAPLFSIIVAFRFMQVLAISGVGEPAWFAMFNAVPPERRDQVRAFISGVPEQAGTFLAGGLLIVGEQSLTPQHLYAVGLFAAAACTYILVQAQRGYNRALVEALRTGRPNLFFSEERPFGGFHQDAAAVQTSLKGLRDPDPAIRRVSAEILGHLSLPESTNALVEGLSDADPLVRAASLKALAQSGAASALLDIAARLSDPEPEVRFEAVAAISTLTVYPTGLSRYLSPLLNDENAKVSTRTAVALLRTDPSNDKAKKHLRQMAVLGGFEERTHAIAALGDWGDAEAFEFLSNELQDEAIAPVIRRNILVSMKRIDAAKAVPHLIASLVSQHRLILDSTADLLASIGGPALTPVLEALQDDRKAGGALLALEKMPPPPADSILSFARAQISLACEYDAMMRAVNTRNGNEAMSLLGDTLHNVSHGYGLRGLRAIGLLGDREAMKTAIENIQSADAGPRANVIEALESISAKWRGVLQPLMNLWEDGSVPQAEVDWSRLLNDPDEWVRECAAFAQGYGETKMETITTLPLMDRILFLKRVPLFAALTPTDLKQVAAIASEETFPDGEVIAYHGEPGDAMFVIVSGEVRVCIEENGVETELARRRSGEYVGELSIINREPRNATLIAQGDVRALCIDQKTFEGLIRERPEVSLFIIQVLSKRLKELMDKKG